MVTHGLTATALNNCCRSNTVMQLGR